MLQWKLYSDKAFNKSALYNRDFPWYNSTQLDNLYQDKNTRRQALLFLFYLPNTTWDLENQTKVLGIEGAKESLIQADREYQKISELYPDGKLKSHVTGEDVNLRFYFYDWLVDRGHHGLSNTCLQFEGVNATVLRDIVPSHPIDFWNYLKDYDGLDQYLTKNWSYWDLVKAIASYERWNPNVTEADEVQYITPQVLKMFGFPVERLGISPMPLGTPGAEWAVSLPDYIANEAKNKWDNRLLIGPGNIFGLYSCKYGLTKDGISNVFLRVGPSEIKIYLMKES